MIVHTVYKTTNSVNARFYIGMHKTANPNDVYLGSGTVIKLAVKKHGADKFKKEVLFVFLTAKEAADKEVELLLAEKANPLCYNLSEGGEGGFEYVNKHYVYMKRKLFKKAQIVRLEKLRTDSEFRKRVGERISQGQHKRYKANPEVLEATRKRALKFQPLAVEAWRGQKHDKETRKVLSDNHRGELNSMFGMRWMYNDSQQQAKRFPKSEILAQQAAGWQLGRAPIKYSHCLLCGKTFSNRDATKFCSRQCYLDSGMASEMGKLSGRPKIIKE